MSIYVAGDNRARTIISVTCSDDSIDFVKGYIQLYIFSNVSIEQQKSPEFRQYCCANDGTLRRNTVRDILNNVG